MTDPTPDRRGELIAAALHGDLDPDEREEFELLRRGDPTVDAEFDGLSRMLASIPSLAPWDESTPSPGLRDRIVLIPRSDDAGLDVAQQPLGTTRPVLAETPVQASGPASVPRAPVQISSRRRRWATPLAAAACVAVGLGAGVLATNGIASIQPDAPTGPPGTLGAVEQVDFTGEPTGVQVAGSLVAHTWGTETLLEIDGLTVGDSYSVVVVTRDGARLEAGSFLGSDVTVDCQMNAAVYRDEAASVEITDAGGSLVAAAALPDAISPDAIS